MQALSLDDAASSQSAADSDFSQSCRSCSASSLEDDLALLQSQDFVDEMLSASPMRVLRTASRVIAAAS